MYPVNQNFNYSVVQNTQTTSSTEQNNQVQNRFTSIDTNNLKEISLSNSANTIIRTNNQTIDKYNASRKQVEKQLQVVRLQKIAALHNHSILLEQIEDGNKIDKDHYSNLKSEIKNLKKQELELINKEFNIQKSITQLEEEIQIAVENPPKAKKIQFDGSVKVHEQVKEKTHYQQRMQFLDQSYTERTSLEPKTKVKPRTFVQKSIKELVRKYTKLEAIDYEKIRLIIEAKIDQIEYAQNLIQKERFTSELDLQLSALEKKNQNLIIEQENNKRAKQEKEKIMSQEKNGSEVHFSDEDSTESTD